MKIFTKLYVNHVSVRKSSTSFIIIDLKYKIKDYFKYKKGQLNYCIVESYSPTPTDQGAFHHQFSNMKYRLLNLNTCTARKKLKQSGL